MAIWTHKETGNYEAEQVERAAVFRKIASHRNWKERIDAWIDASDFDECNEAGIWFAASPLTIVARRSTKGVAKVRVQGAGYYANVGA